MSSLGGLSVCAWQGGIPLINIVDAFARDLKVL